VLVGAWTRGFALRAWLRSSASTLIVLYIPRSSPWLDPTLIVWLHPALILLATFGARSRPQTSVFVSLVTLCRVSSTLIILVTYSGVHFKVRSM
jgi:hypothetical protein